MKNRVAYDLRREKHGQLKNSVVNLDGIRKHLLYGGKVHRWQENTFVMTNDFKFAGLRRSVYRSYVR